MKNGLCCVVWLPLLLLSTVISVPQVPTDISYRVVINHEEQYSLWLADASVPKGWKDIGFKGSQDRCQAYIREVWTDMRPLSIRKMNLPADTKYRVVINHEEQYAIWPAERAVAKGWKPTGPAGTLEKCTQYIRKVWTDMRPLSLRQRLRKERQR